MDSPTRLIYDTLKQLNNGGAIPSLHLSTLESGLILAFTDFKRLPRAEIRRGRKEVVAHSRQGKAGKIYLQVLDEDSHIFLPFILAISPRRSRTFDLKGFFLHHRDSGCKLQLSNEAGRQLEEIARRQEFTQSTHYKKLMKSLFPQGL